MGRTGWMERKDISQNGLRIRRNERSDRRERQTGKGKILRGNCYESLAVKEQLLHGHAPDNRRCSRTHSIQSENPLILPALHSFPHVSLLILFHSFPLFWPVLFYESSNNKKTGKKNNLFLEWLGTSGIAPGMLAVSKHGNEDTYSANATSTNHLLVGEIPFSTQ